MRDVDELFFLDIEATNEKRSPDFDLIDDIADDCFMPLTIGGGVNKLKDIEFLLKVGADKISINTAAFIDQNIITEAANKFGSQCVVISIDVKKNHGKYQVYVNSGKTNTGKELSTYVREVEKRGAGEILLTSIENDGTMNGYDYEIINEISGIIRIPIIASGGAGRYDDMVKAIENGASAVAAASMFHFTEQTPSQAKEFLRKKGFSTRT